MSTTTTELEVRALTEADDPTVIEVLGVALGGGPTGGRTAEFFRWKHRLNPFGPSPGLVAVQEGRILGVRLFMRWALQADGQPVKAARAVDTATDPAFQGKGIFRSLTLGLLDQLDASGEVDLVFNTPNASSRPGYLKMGWQPVGTLPVRLAPGRRSRPRQRQARLRRAARSPPP
jgi:GNAT superfamily N-acetyltransferase